MSGCPGSPKFSAQQAVDWLSSLLGALFQGLSSWEVCQCAHLLRLPGGSGAVCVGGLNGSLEVWENVHVHVWKSPLWLGINPKGKEEGQTTDEAQDQISPRYRAPEAIARVCTPEVLDCKPSLGNPWLTEPRTKDRYSPLCSLRDNSDLYSTGLFAEPLEGSNDCP